MTDQTRGMQSVQKTRRNVLEQSQFQRHTLQAEPYLPLNHFFSPYKVVHNRIANSVYCNPSFSSPR